MWQQTRRALATSLLVMVLLSACGGGEPAVEPAEESNSVTSTGNQESVQAVADPSPGRYVGSTSQGMSISLWVEEVDGALMVSQVQYKIEMRADTFSVTTELNMPSSREMAIEGGYFSGSHATGNNTEVLTGRFVGEDKVEGDLICTNTHPQGLGTATGSVSFEAFLVSP